MEETRAAQLFRVVDLDLEPPEAAECLAGQDGFVFLDSSLDGPDCLSLIGTHPDRVVSGSAADWPFLVEELARRSRVGADHGLPAGAAVGWVGFDGTFRFGFYDDLLVFRHRDGLWLACGEPMLPGSAGARGLACPAFQSTMREAEFCERVGRAREYIAAGDIYQVCLAHHFWADWEDSWAWPFYSALRDASPSPHGACLRIGDTAVLSASPETFLRMSGPNVSTRPIKGTRPRRHDPGDDERSAYDLMTSPKEIAELVMITDLERNDLGRVAEIGSVRVTELLKLERFRQVFHLVSTVEASLQPTVGHAAALAACMPGGSISGAPKKRALEIIAELEPEPRGLYTGAAGYFGYNGESQFSILIRSVVARGGRASFGVGAGIVADSDPAMEWRETLDKASGILAAADACLTGAAGSAGSGRFRKRWG